MNSSEEQVRAAIAEQAGEWFVANDERPLDSQDSESLAAWLKTSPVHIEEFLSVSAIARDLKQARTDPEYSLEAILARAHADEEPRVQALGWRDSFAVRARLCRGNGGERGIESWLVLVVERKARAAAGRREHHGITL